MPRKQDSLFEDIAKTAHSNPRGGAYAAVGLLPAAAGLYYLWPAGNTKIFGVLGGLIFALCSFGALAGSLIGFVNLGIRKKRFDNTLSLEDVRNLSWREFEQLVADAYRRQGYKVEEGPGSNDGGIDLRLLGPSGEYSAVQCKQWKTWKVGRPEIQKFYGAMAADKRQGQGIFICCGDYSKDARAYARQVGIKLLGASELLALLKTVNDRVSLAAHGSVEAPSSKPAVSDQTPTCPKCGAMMTIRTARRGSRSGESFWGCTTYPHCQGKRPHV